MNLITQTEEELKLQSLQAIEKLSEYRQREALVEVKALLTSGYNWEYIATALNDPWINLEVYGFAKVWHSQQFKERILSQIEAEKYQASIEEKYKKLLLAELFGDILDGKETVTNV